MKPTKVFSKMAVVRDYCRRFPATPTTQLSRILVRDEKRLFPDVQMARECVRRARGKKSSQAGRLPGAAFCVPLQPQAPPEEFRLPEAWADRVGAEPWTAYPVDGPARVGVLTDVHFPYYDREAVVLALRHLKRWEPTVILLGGDFVDDASISWWERDPRLRRFPEEVAATRELLETLRDNWPKARIVWKEGNHEERYMRYLWRHAAEMLGLPGFTEEAVYTLDKWGVEYVRHKRPVHVGKMLFLHGHEYTFAISNPVNPARGLFLRAKVNAVCGHFHQSSQHSERNAKDEVVSTFSTGCLCSLHPLYRPLNNWNHGFATVEVAQNGAFELENLRIVDGKVY